jgi:predicted short-subunit dehydrogenase-like oxidoreductase (DUF2520 family)
MVDHPNGELTMRIGFIGAGKVAVPFGRYLHKRGINISGYFDRHVDKVAHACDQTRSKAFKNISETALHSDIILITTQDDKIAAACRQLCEDKSITPRHLVGHMSGAHSSRILGEAKKLGATVFSLHPLQAFADEEKSLTDLPNAYFSLESEESGPDPVLEMLSRMGNPYFKLSPEVKSLYHLSACIVSNYLVTLMASGLDALEKSGIDPRQGFTAMRPLIEGTLSNIAKMGPAKALTGPVARGDAGTIGQHIKALQSPEFDDLRSVYTFMGLKTLELASKETLKNQDKADAVRKLLEDK